jgi:hypothetical protein
MTLESIEPTPEEWLENVRAGIDKGLAEVAAGQGLDGETALREMHFKLFGKYPDQAI